MHFTPSNLERLRLQLKKGRHNDGCAVAGASPIPPNPNDRPGDPTLDDSWE